MTGDELDIKICRLLTLSFISSAAKCFASDVAMEVTTNAVQLVRRRRLHRRFPGRTHDARRKDHADLRGTNQIQRVVMARALLA